MGSARRCAARPAGETPTTHGCTPSTRRRRAPTCPPVSGLARARYGHRPGHPVVIARRPSPDLLDGLRGDQGARAFLVGRTDVIAVDCADLASGADIDVS